MTSKLATVSREDNAVLLTIPVEPAPTPRPRVNKWGVAYYPAAYKLYRKALEDCIPPAATTFTGGILTVVLAVCKPLKASKFTTPLGDCENLSKGVLDALTDKGYWKDDRQIVDLHIIKRFPAEGEEPHFVVEITEID